MKIKLSDIARIAGVSKATASRALRNSPLVKDETRQLVIETAKALKYQPNALAQAMATKRSGIIGFLMYRKGPPYVAHTFYGPILDGAIEAAANHGYHIVLAASNDIADTFDEHFIQDSIDGALLVSYHSKEVIKEFRRRGIPLVVINDWVESENNTFILDDNYNGTCAIMKYLIVEKGHKKIAHSTERLDHPSYHIRYKAFKDMLALYEIPDLYECVSAHDTTFASGVEAMSHLLSYDTPPTAVFATTDTLALGAMHAAKSAGFRIPEDIAIAGYDDIEAASMSDPPLTTVRVDRENIGKTAVDALVKQIANAGEPTRKIVIKNKLVVRAST